MNDEQSIYAYQRRTLPVLLGWGIGSAVAGAMWLRSKSDWWQGFGSQFLAWGLIDAAIAAFGLRGATGNLRKWQAGKVDDARHAKDARTFERIVWFNAVLDVFYIMGGRALAANNPTGTRKHGMGWGIIVQGAYLLVWDIILGLGAGGVRRG